MAVQTAYVGNLFLVRWGKPSDASLNEVRETFAAGKPKRDRPVHIAIVPADMVADSQEYRRIVEVTQELLAESAYVAVVIEAPGAQGAMLRSAMSTVRLSSNRHYRLSMVGSVERALAWAPGPKPEVAALYEALAAPELPEPALRVA